MLILNPQDLLQNRSLETVPINIVGRSWIEVGLLRMSSPPESFTVPSAIGNMNLSPFMGVNTSFASSLFAWISDASIFSNSSMSATKMSPFQIRPATIAHCACLIPLLLVALKAIHEKNWKRLCVLKHFICQIVLELLQPFWKIMGRVSSYFFVVIILIWIFGFGWSTRRVSSYFLTHTLTFCRCWILRGSYGFLR